MGRYIVTGADGFIASHLCDHLIMAGHHVVAFCHYHSRQELRNISEGERLQVVWGDITAGDTLMQMPREGVDGVFHLAAAVDVAWSLRLSPCLVDDGYYYNNNTLGSHNVMEFAARANARCLLMSTSEVYGTPETPPIRESDTLHPQSPYAESKVLMEFEARSRILEGHEIVIARPFNTYGPRQTERGVIAKICRHAAECASDDHGERRFKASASPLKLGNVTTRRDWMHVDDTCRGLIAIMERGRRGEAYNLGTGRMVTVREAAEMAGIECESGHGQDRGAAEVLCLQADASKARVTLGWEPKIALEDGLQATIRSYIHA